MLTAMPRKKLLSAFFMLIALAAMSLSVIGGAFSHGVAELTDTPPLDPADHHHSHDAHSHEFDRGAEIHAQHDPGNHTHETIDQLKLPPLPQIITAIQQPLPFTGGLPRKFPYRLDRPPKARLPA